MFSAGRDYSKKAPVGIYDSKLLCTACEASLSPWDDHAARVFNTPLPGNIKAGNIWERTDVNIHKLRIFFASLLSTPTFAFR